MMNLHHIMFCYAWNANGQHGEGYQILQNETKELTMSDINEAIDFIKIGIEKAMSHSKNSIKVIFTNIVHLNHCTNDEFYNKKDS